MSRTVGWVVLCACVALPAASAQTALDTDGIAKAIGRQGAAQGDVYRVAFPRTDLTVTIGGVTIKPGLALGGWIAFRKAGAGAIAHGDLVLLPERAGDGVHLVADHDEIPRWRPPGRFRRTESSSPCTGLPSRRCTIT